MTPEEREVLRDMRAGAGAATIILAFALVTIAGGLVLLFFWVGG